MPKGTKGIITNNLVESEFIVKNDSAIEIIGAEVYIDGNKVCENICKAYSKVGDCMDKIKQLLYKYLDTDSINLIGMCHKIEDIWWLIENGYQEDFKIIRHVFKVEGEITDKGAKFFDKYNKEVERLHKKTRKILTIENEEKTRKTIRKYVLEHENMDFSFDSKLLKGLTENEKYAFRYFSRDPMDSGKR